MIANPSIDNYCAIRPFTKLYPTWFRAWTKCSSCWTDYVTSSPIDKGHWLGDSLLISHVIEDSLHDISTLARDSRVTILTKDNGYTLLLSEVVNPLLATQLPLNASTYTRSSPKERPQRGNIDRSQSTGLASKISLSISSLRIFALLLCWDYHLHVNR